MDRIEEIRQRTEAATPGPWKTVTHEEYSTVDVDEQGGENIAMVGSAIADADFIAHAREDVPYLLSEVDRMNALHKREIIVAGEYAQRVIDLTARAEAAEAERDAAIEDMTAVLKRDSDDICAYCKNRIECKNEQCEKYSSGVGDDDGNYPDWKWTCMDFDYGTCFLLADTPCNGCFDDDYKGFEWRGPQEAER